MGIKEGQDDEKPSEGIIVRWERYSALDNRVRDPILLKERRKICLGKMIFELGLEQHREQ